MNNHWKKSNAEWLSHLKIIQRLRGMKKSKKKSDKTLKDYLHVSS